MAYDAGSSKYADSKYSKDCKLVGFGHLGQCVLTRWSHDSRLISVYFVLFWQREGEQMYCNLWHHTRFGPTKGMRMCKPHHPLPAMANSCPDSMPWRELIKTTDAQTQGKPLWVGDERAGNMHWVTTQLNGVMWEISSCSAASKKCHVYIFKHLQQTSIADALS